MLALGHIQCTLRYSHPPFLPINDDVDIGEAARLVHPTNDDAGCMSCDYDTACARRNSQTSARKLPLGVQLQDYGVSVPQAVVSRLVAVLPGRVAMGSVEGLERTGARLDLVYGPYMNFSSVSGYPTECS